MSAFYINLHVEKIQNKWFVLNAMDRIESAAFDTKEEAEKDIEKTKEFADGL